MSPLRTTLSCLLLLAPLWGCQSDEEPAEPTPESPIVTEIAELGAACDNRCARVADRCAEVENDRCEQAVAMCREHCGPDHMRPEIRPRPRACIAGCAVRSARAIRDCLAQGGERRECAERGARMGMRCRRECRGDDDPEPPADRCAQGCRARGEMVARMCVEAGGEPERCRERGHLHAQACFEDHCHADDQPPSCQDGCAERARAAAERCVAEGGDRQECVERARAAARACIEDHCEVPVSCEDRCARRSRALYEACLERAEAVGADDGEARCEALAQAAHDRCLEARCEEPEPPTCQDRCHQAGRTFFEACIEENGADARERCAHGARRVTAACLHENCDAPEPPTCQDRCHQAAREWVGQCIEENGRDSAERCQAEGRRRAEACVAEGCEEPEPPTCESRCRARAGHWIRECIADNGEENAERCRDEGERLFRECVADNCENPEPPSCEDACTARGRMLLRQCIESGRDEEACGQRARTFVAECTERCDGVPPDCEGVCRARAQAVGEECLERGGAPERCRGLAERGFNACVNMQCEDEGENEPECNDICNADAQAAARLCQRADDPRACRENVREAHGQCLEACEG